MTACRELVESAESSLRVVLHESLEDCTVRDLDGILVELVEVAWRASELAGRLDRALGCWTGGDRLRLDSHGREWFWSPEQATEAARSELSLGIAAAVKTAGLFHDARQITSTIGTAFDIEPEEEEF